MKLSLKKAIISAVVVLAGVSLFMPLASVFAVAAPLQTAPTAQQQAAANQAAAQRAAEQKAAQDKAAADAAAKQQALDAAAALSNNSSSSSPSSSSSSQDLPEPEARCEAGVMGWVLCPVIKMGQEFVKDMENFIVDRLDTGPIRTTGRYENLHKAWAGFRDLANVFFIFVFIVIIFAQTLNIKMDSYSIKMMLPRLIVAVIAIQFSFFIMQIGVDISNIFGAGIANLFNSVVPLGAEGGAGMDVKTAFGALTIAGILGGTAAGIAIVGGLVVPVLLLLLAGALSLLGVIITVWLRVLVLQFLIILSPLAFVAWIMPNTEKWFKMWRDNSVKLLLMYPIIVFMISAGALATHITSVSAEDGPFAKILAACIPIIIFLMIPAALKASGSIMNYVGGTVMGRMNGYGKAVRSSSLMSNSKADLKKKASIMMDDYAKGKDGITTLGQKSKALVRRNVGRQFSGNTFSYGRSGRLKIAKSVEHARHEIDEEWQTMYEGEGYTNPQLAQIAASLGDHSIKEVPVKNSYGKSKTLKVNHHMAEAALAQLIKQQGMVEFSELLDGPKVKPGETSRSGTGLWDHETNQWKNKDIQKTVTRAVGSNAGAVLAKVPHGVHLQGDKAYGDLKGDAVANLGAGSGITASQQAVKWNRVNAINAIKDIVSSGALASRAQNDVLKSYKRELLKAYDEGKFAGYEFDVDDFGKMDVAQFLNTFVSDGGQVTQTVSGNIKQDQDAFNRILQDVLKEQEKYQSEIDTARDHKLNNPGGH